VTEAGHYIIPAPKDVRGQLVLPPDRSGYREERDGSPISHHLQASAESITMNVGGPYAERCSPAMNHRGVGAAIVLGARESRVQGEGRQGSDVRRTISRRSLGEFRVEPGYPGCFDERKPMTDCREVATPWRAGCGESRMPGSERGVGRHSSAVRPAPTLLG
jgi:hypothetical protein